MRRRGRRRNEVHRRPRPEDRPVDPVQRPGRFPYIAVYLVSDDERIDVLALVSVRRGSKPPLPAGQTSSRRHCSPQIVRKKSNCGPQQPLAADHRISVLSQVRGTFRRQSTTPVDRRKPASSFRRNADRPAEGRPSLALPPQLRSCPCSLTPPAWPDSHLAPTPAHTQTVAPFPTPDRNRAFAVERKLVHINPMRRALRPQGRPHPSAYSSRLCHKRIPDWGSLGCPSGPHRIDQQWT